MKNLILIFVSVMFFSFAADAQSIAGKYSNPSSTWEFIETDVEQEYSYKGYNSHGKLISTGFGFDSKKQGRVVVVVKRLDKIDDIGYAVCVVDANSINIKTP